MRTFERIKSRHLYLVGYLVLVLFGSIGFMRVEILAARVEVEAIERTRVVCEVQNDQRQAIIQFAETLVAVAQRGTEPTPEEQDRAELFVNEVRESLPLQECPPQPVTETWWKTFVQ